MKTRDEVKAKGHFITDSLWESIRRDEEHIGVKEIEAIEEFFGVEVE